MSKILSIRLEDELWERVHSQQVQPRQIITEALLHYFRYKDGWEPEKKIIEISSPETDVYNSKHQFPDESFIIDVELVKLENECDYLKKEIKFKEELLARADDDIARLDRMVMYLQTVNYRMNVTFMPGKIGFLAGLLPSGRKAKKTKQELDEMEHDFIVEERKIKMEQENKESSKEQNKEETALKVKNKVKSSKNKSKEKIKQ